MKVFFNEKLASAVFRILSSCWEKKDEIFADVVLPQNKYSISASTTEKEMALWLFFNVLFERGGRVSGNSIAILRRLWGERPELFDPKTVAEKWSVERIRHALVFSASGIGGNGGGNGKVKNAGVLSVNLQSHAECWHENAVRLHRYWNGDVRNLFRGVSSFEEAFKNIDYKRNKIGGMLGMRRKISSLLTIWLQEKNIIPVFPTPLPIDFHALRVLWATEIIKVEGAENFSLTEKHTKKLLGQNREVARITENFVDQIALWSQNFLPGAGLSHSVVNPAVWVLSRELCARSVQNSSGNFHRKNREEMTFGYDDIRTSFQLPVHNSCEDCPIEMFCRWAIPSAPYYRWGLLVRLGPRFLNSQLKLF